MRTRRIWLVAIAVAVAAAAAAAVAFALGGGNGGSTSIADFEPAVVNTRDRVDFALGRLSKAQSLDELLARMDEAAVAIDAAAGDLGDVEAPTELADERERLVRQLEQLAADVQGTADQARVPGFEEILVGAGGFNFESWDAINTILAELRTQGIAVRPLARQTTT